MLGTLLFTYIQSVDNNNHVSPEMPLICWLVGSLGGKVSSTGVPDESSEAKSGGVKYMVFNEVVIGNKVLSGTGRAQSSSLCDAALWQGNSALFSLILCRILFQAILACTFPVIKYWLICTHATQRRRQDWDF